MKPKDPWSRYLSDVERECRKMTRAELIAKCVRLERVLLIATNDSRKLSMEEMTNGRGGMISPHP